jgi:hypothetical protein
MDQDKDFIITVIQYLQNKYGIIFFITSKDFDVLYRWWEKRIPLPVVKEAIDTVVERWRAKNREIRSFSGFGYEVKKKFNAFLQLNVGSERGHDGSPLPQGNTLTQDIEYFFAHFPQELSPLRQAFEEVDSKRRKHQTFDMTGIFSCLLDLFKEDQPLELKCGIFLKNLSPGLRKPEIEQRYRLNYLINKFKIPDFSTESGLS